MTWDPDKNQAFKQLCLFESIELRRAKISKRASNVFAIAITSAIVLAMVGFRTNSHLNLMQLRAELLGEIEHVF